MKLSTIFAWFIGLFSKKKFYKEKLCGVEFFDPVNKCIEGLGSITLRKFAGLRLNEVRVHPRGHRSGTNPYRHPFKFENGKYNLNKWDSTYWENLKSFVKYCKKKGIHVTYELINQSEFKGTYDSKRYCPWYALNNVNGYVRSNSHSDISGGLFVTSGPAAEKMKLYISKLLTVIGKYPNVMLHTCNEPLGGDQVGWHAMVIDYIKNNRKWKGKICINIRRSTLSATDVHLLALGANYAEHHFDYNMFNRGEVERFINEVKSKAPRVTPIITTDGAGDLTTETLKQMARYSLDRGAGFRYWKHVDHSSIVWNYIKALHSVFK